ncbi:MAG: hypothetical protein FWG30_02550 [Eubacteriaceae bacterium]|nr:hypothetical protein [Eubacteriaceae bacterium]
MDRRERTVISAIAASAAAAGAVAAGVGFLTSAKGERYVNKSKRAISRAMSNGVEKTAKGTSETLHNVADKISKTFT